MQNLISNLLEYRKQRHDNESQPLMRQVKTVTLRPAYDLDDGAFTRTRVVTDELH